MHSYSAAYDCNASIFYSNWSKRATNINSRWTKRSVASHTILLDRTQFPIYSEWVFRHSRFGAIPAHTHTHTHTKIMPPDFHNVCRQSIFRRFKIRFYFRCMNTSHYSLITLHSERTLWDRQIECLYSIPSPFSLTFHLCVNHVKTYIGLFYIVI